MRLGSATPTDPASTRTKAECAATRIGVPRSHPCADPMVCVTTARRVTHARPVAARSEPCAVRRTSAKSERKGSRAMAPPTVARARRSARRTASATMVLMVTLAVRMRSVAWRCGAGRMRSARTATKAILVSRTTIAALRAPGARPMVSVTMGPTGIRVSETGSVTWGDSATPHSSARRATRGTRASRAGWTVRRPHPSARRTNNATTGRTGTLVSKANATLGCGVVLTRPVSLGSKGILVRARQTAVHGPRFAIRPGRAATGRSGTGALRERAAPACCAGPGLPARPESRGIRARQRRTVAAGLRCAGPTERATMEALGIRAVSACRA